MRPLILAILFCAVALAGRPDWDAMREQIRQTFHISEPPPKLAERLYGRFNPTKDVTADRISFGTAYDLRVPAIVYHPAGATILKRPALIIVNGHSGDKSSWYASYAGILYARAGAIVLTYDPIGEFERNSEKKSQTRQHDTPFNSDDVARRLEGLMISDIMQASRYLAGRSDVDPKSIAVLGFSMGSFVSSLACAVDTSIHACVLVGGGDLDGSNGYWDQSAKMCQGMPYQALKFLGDRGPAIFALNARRGPTLIYNGTADKVVDIPNHGPEFFENLRRQTVALLGTHKDVFEFSFAEGRGHEPYFLTKPVALWLNEKLKFPNWTKKQLQAMDESEVHGAMALGKDIPEVPRENLQAVPEMVWNAEKENYVYESFVTRAH